MIAAFILVGLVVAIAAVSAFLVWDRQPRRLDAEARVAAYDATVVPKPRPRGSAS